MTLLYVPAGEFTMGSDTGHNDEKPVHTVYLDAFWIDQTEVTNAMYTLCVQSGECIDHSEAIHKARPDFDTSRYANPLYANYAVVYVNWNDATAYCDWAGRRLPTEAEWEKAASWDDTTKTKHVYPWGDIIDCSYANYHDLNHRMDCWTDAPVKSYENGKSPYGAYDMAGNVFEWVNDWYSATYYKNSPSVNPLGPDAGIFRGARDGYHAFSVRSANRSGGNLGVGFYSYENGFRCAQSADRINTTDQTLFVTSANTPYPTTTPISLHVQPATNQGDRFTATADGIYRFTMEKGAIRVCPPNPNLPDCGTWNSQIQVFKNRDILWGFYESRDIPRIPANLFPLGDYVIGVNYPSTDLAVVEKANKGHYTDIPLKKDDYLILIPKDCQSCYGDNEGGVDVSVSIVGELP
jgi:formylglycine-generating enzyme required for sulfatase activity